VQKPDKTSDFRLKCARFRQKYADFRVFFSPPGNRNPRLSAPASARRKARFACEICWINKALSPGSARRADRLFHVKQTKNIGKNANFHKKQRLCGFSPHRPFSSADGVKPKRAAKKHRLSRATHCR
jgi:hypothetical protein